MKRATTISTMFTVAVGLLLAGCQADPPTRSDREDLHDNVDHAIRHMKATDPGLEAFLDKSHGYVIFPKIGKGALIAGGAYGRGEVYEKGDFVGYADITQWTIGAQAGGQSFNELIVFENKETLDRFERGETTMTADVSAVVIKTGASSTAKYQNGMVVFAEPIAGFMVEAAVGGQTFSYEPK